MIELACSLKSHLAPGCERIEIAGSIRRGKPNPKDIEIVCIPAIVPIHQIEMFGAGVAPVTTDGQIRLFDAALENLLAGGAWAFDRKLPRNGKRYKRLVHVESGTPCDLYVTDARRWGVIFVLRTGPGDFSKSLVVRAGRLGMFVDDGLLHRHRRQYGKDDKPLPCPRGEACSLIVETPGELDFFAALGLPFIEPEDRRVEKLARKLP